MIPVTLQPEPPSFDRLVRQPGLEWLAEHRIDPNQPPPRASDLPPYWREILYELWKKYEGTCAYLAIYFEYVTGAATTDHFLAKSRDSGQAYEWSNYRLACAGPNRKKSTHELLDPFEIGPETFHLNLQDGSLKPNPNLPSTSLALAEKTIGQLELDDKVHREMRVNHFTNYLKTKDRGILRKYSPFVYFEAKRQGLL